MGGLRVGLGWGTRAPGHLVLWVPSLQAEAFGVPGILWGPHGILEGYPGFWATWGRRAWLHRVGDPRVELVWELWAHSCGCCCCFQPRLGRTQGQVGVLVVCLHRWTCCGPCGPHTVGPMVPQDLGVLRGVDTSFPQTCGPPGGPGPCSMVPMDPHAVAAPAAR